MLFTIEERIKKWHIHSSCVQCVDIEYSQPYQSVSFHYESSLVPSHTEDTQKRKLCLYQHLEPCWMSHLVQPNVSPIWNGLLAVTEIQATSFAQYVHRYTKKTFSLWGRCMSLHYEHGSTKYRRRERWSAGDSLADLWPESQALCQDEGPHFVL